MTRARRTLSDEPEASLRAELIEQVATAQAELLSEIDALRQAAAQGGDAGTLIMAQNQLAHLAGLTRRIDTANGVSLASIRAEVAAYVAASQATVLHARASMSNGDAAEINLRLAQAEAQRVTSDFVRDFYEQKIFDPYLRFDTPEEEQAYREREEPRRRAIEEARALGTPEGDLLAARLALAQLDDAGAHGATDSPDFQSTRNNLTRTEQGLSAALAQSSATAQIEASEKLDAPAAPVEIPAELLASLSATGVTVPDQNQTGHGVAANASRPSQLGFV
ncbi:hypothetical protein ACO2Q1_16260 [Brevundimonas sp. VNH65]|uniref:hypothetical protein n=1 Tax=Brevundimonas sp. VNH65 TaxID=3400917 RepID=UPI003C07FCD9